MKELQRDVSESLEDSRRGVDSPIPYIQISSCNLWLKESSHSEFRNYPVHPSSSLTRFKLCVPKVPMQYGCHFSPFKNSTCGAVLSPVTRVCWGWRRGKVCFEAERKENLSLNEKENQGAEFKGTSDQPYSFSLMGMAKILMYQVWALSSYCLNSFRSCGLGQYISTRCFSF